jgi:hypothetical protein
MRGLPPPRALARVATLVAVLAGLCAPLAATAAEPAKRPFGPDSPWNVTFAKDAPLQQNSAGLVSDLVRQVNERTPWINTTRWSVPVYTVPADQPMVHVKLDIPGYDFAWNHPMFTGEADAFELQRTLDQVPIPPEARPNAGTDLSLLVYQPATDTAWELWQARDVPRDPLPWPDPTPGWHAVWGARVDNVSNGSGVNPAPWGASASGLALLGGLVRISELQAGHIDHAIGIAVTQPKAGEFVAPATRTDGTYTGPNAIPEGTRFRLDPALDLDTLELPPVTRMIAEAAQRYGLIVRDTAGNVVVYGEDPTPTGSNPYPDLFEGLSPDRVMRAFPWNRLEAISPDATPIPTSPTAPIRPVHRPTQPPVRHTRVNRVREARHHRSHRARRHNRRHRHRRRHAAERRDRNVVQAPRARSHSRR